MNKRGQKSVQEVSHQWITIFLAVLAGVALLGVAVNMGSMSEYKKGLYATDIALAIDALHIIPMDATFVYPYSLEKEYGLRVDQQNVIVSQEGSGKAFPYTADPEYQYGFEPILPNHPETIWLAKQGDRISIAQERFTHVVPHCQEQGTQSAIALDPGIDTNFVEIEEESALLLRLARRAKGFNPSFEITRDEELADMQTRISAYPDSTLISLDIDPEADSGYYIYTNNAEAAQLACHILKELAMQGPTNYAIIPVDTTLLSSNDPRMVLDRNLPTLYIQIRGEYDQDLVAEAIANGVSSYAP